MERAKIPGLAAGKRHPDWGQLYTAAKEEALPWHFPSLDPDVLAEMKLLKGLGKRILDIGCGLGNQSHLITQNGHLVWATDVSEAAIRRARLLYKGTHFLVDDITHTSLREEFDILIDRGCFHVLEPASRASYLRTVGRLLCPRGVLWLKVMSEENENVDFGPHCFSKLALHQIFSSNFEVLKIHQTIYHGSTSHSPRAWFAVMRKKGSHA